MNPIAMPISIESNDNKTVGSCQIEFYTTNGAVYKGLKMFFVTILVAAISIVLPGVHFISVPLGILASPFVGGYFYFTCKGSQKNLLAEFNCPDCQTQNHVSTTNRAAYYVSQCVQCQHELRLTPQQL